MKARVSKKLPLVIVGALVPLLCFQFHLDSQSLGSPGTLVRHNPKPRTTKTLQFAPCGSFEDHRLGVALGVLLAKYLGRTIILPSLRPNDSSSTMHLSNLYEESELLQTLNKHQIPWRPSPATAEKDVVTCDGMDASTMACMEMIKGQYHDVDDLIFECPFPHPSVSPNYISLHSDLFWDVMEALRPSYGMAALIRSQMGVIESAFNNASFNFVDALEEGGDAVMALEAMGLNSEHGVYLTRAVEGVGSGALRTVRQIDTEKLEGRFSDVRKRMLDYYVGLAATKSLSDPRNTFGGLLMLERRHRRLFASGYVGERHGLKKRVPLFELPWVVFHDAGDDNLDYMLKIAVRSVNHKKALWPICVVSGKQRDSAAWLAENNVTVVFHEPKWLRDYYQGEAAAIEQASRFELGTETKVVPLENALQIEIPNIDMLRQFEYVLFTGPSVLLRRRLPLEWFNQRLPAVVGVAESDSIGRFPFGSSVALWNVSAARENYESLVAYVANPKRKPKSLVLKAGQGVQSLKDVGKNWTFPKHGVAASYMGYDVNAYMVDFSGMAPHEYAQYVRTGMCVHNICYDGILRGWCGYIFEWASFLEPEDAETGLPVMKQCIRKVCSFRGGCRRWKQVMAELLA